MSNGIMRIDSQGLLATANFLDGQNSSADLPVGVIPQWTVKDPTVVLLVPSDDGLSAQLVPQKLGETEISVTAKCDPQTGQDIITQTDRVSVVLSDATQVNISFSVIVKG